MEETVQLMTWLLSRLVLHTDYHKGHIDVKSHKLFEAPDSVILFYSVIFVNILVIPFYLHNVL